jgi:hypothetical protein
MTVPSTTRRAGPLLGNGVTTSFPFSFRIFQETDIRVVKTLAGVDTDLVLNTDYTVAVNPTQDTNPGGFIVPTVVAAVGVSFIIIGNAAYEQSIDLPDGGAYRAEQVEDGFDKLAILIQQLKEQQDRSLAYTAATGAGFGTLPDVATRANKFLMFDADGVAFVSSGTGADAGLREDLFEPTGAALVSHATFTLANILTNSVGRVVDSITALKAVDKTKFTRAFVTGYYAAGRGGGHFWYDSTDTTTADNGGTVIVATDGARWKSVDLSEKTVLQFGSKADGTTNDGATLRSVFASFDGLGGALRVNTGTYKIDASGGAGIAITKPMFIDGDGGVYTAINPALAASTDQTISITPSVTADHTLVRYSGFCLHDPATGLREGQNGIFADTQVVGANLGKFTLRDVMIGQGSGATGYAFFHLNNPANNVNGGLYAALFQNVVLKGGLKLDSSGDSISVVHSILTGSRIGVHASLVAGASLLEMQANNITANWGALKLDAGSRYRFIGNNCEHSTVGSVVNNDSAVVNVTGANGVIYGGVIKENLISRFGASDAATLLRLRNSKGTLVEDNVLLSDNAGTLGMDIGADCTDVRVGANTYSSAMATKITDNGVGTMGVVKTATLLNSWVAFAGGTATLQFMKSSDGMVHVWGAVKNGTTANGTLIATLPVGFRPAEIQRAPAFANDTGTISLAQVTVESTGDLRFNFAKTTETSFNFSFPAANLANSVSLE